MTGYIALFMLRAGLGSITLRSHTHTIGGGGGLTTPFPQRLKSSDMLHAVDDFFRSLLFVYVGIIQWTWGHWH